MTILALFFFVILVGLGGLGIDIGRVYGLRGQMVAYVDQVALASAAELDGQTGSINRAFRTAIGDGSGGPVIATTYNLASTGTSLGIYNLIFLSSIGSGPGPTPATGDVVVCAYQNGAWVDSAGNASNCNTDATANANARIIAVTTTPITVAYMVLPIADIFLGGGVMPSSGSLQMQATAGYKQISCDITPMMICNPDESSTNTDTLFPYNPAVGHQVLMKASGSGAAWTPGDFGLLEQPSAAGGVGCSGSSASATFIQCMLALVDPLTQCVETSVQVAPGQKENTSDGINTRFDMYVQSAGKYHKNNNATYNAYFAPSVNVTKGLKRQGGASCPNNFDASSSTYQLPRDANMKLDTTGTQRFGNGVSYSDAQAYWLGNHGTPTLPPAVDTACKTAGEACRYAMYRYEIETPDIVNKSSSGGENGNPLCTTPGVNNPDRDRRTLIMAVVNCNAAGLKGKTCSNCSYSGIPVVSFVQMFITEPMGLTIDATTGRVTGLSNSSNNLYAEVLGAVEPGDDSGVLHVVPVLYR